MLIDLLAAAPDLQAARSGQTLIADKNYYPKDFEAQPREQGFRLL
jgi:hypothetical protein